MIIYYSTFQTRFGKCLVASLDNKICTILFFDELTHALQEVQSRWKKNDIIKKSQPVHTVIQKYFSDFRFPKSLPLLFAGTEFQKKVWEVLQAIPKGKTATYGEIAQKLGDRGLSRAVGSAVGDNPFAYIIPCHRVLRSDGGIGGYRWGIERKKKMLKFEGITTISNHQD